MSAIQNIAVLGATGSIGRSTLDVIRRHPDRYRAAVLTAGHNLDRLLTLCAEFRPDVAVIGDTARVDEFAAMTRAAGLSLQILAGETGLIEAASLPEIDAVMAAIVGAAGLASTHAAARAGKRLLLANKESLVMSGQLLIDAVQRHGATLLPIDSEHNAVFQSLPQGFARNPDGRGVRRIILTASGGPFRNTPLSALEQVTPAQAVAHPNWSMGRKISVDSATMMNKGLEVIEAHWLFNLPAERIDVVIHPQSVIHSMVEYVDGSVLAQLGNPDMRVPIAHALAWPDRIDSGVASLDLVRVGRFDFEAPDLVRFPCLPLAFAALRAGGTAPAILNAANEAAVAAFLDGRLPYLSIASLIEAVLAELTPAGAGSIEAVMAADQAARSAAAGWLARHT